MVKPIYKIQYLWTIDVLIDYKNLDNGCKLTKLKTSQTTTEIIQKNGQNTNSLIHT